VNTARPGAIDASIGRGADGSLSVALQTVAAPVAAPGTVGDWTRWARAFVSQRVKRDPSSKAKLRPTADFVTAHVAASTNISVDELRGQRRERATLEARLAAYYLCRTMTRASSPQIGRLLGRDHSSVLNGARSAERAMETDAAFAAKVAAMRAMIEESFDISVTRNQRAGRSQCPLCRQLLHDERGQQG
jgi:Bacterial dnaA protein helix-turn-helix